MKTILTFFVLQLLLLVSLQGYAQHSPIMIKVQNPSSLVRNNETVAIQWDLLRKKAPWLDSTKIVVVDKEENRLITQLIGNEFLFQSNFNPKEAKSFTVFNDSMQHSEPLSVTDVKYVLPRKDVTWENDRIAHRIYGSPLAGDVLNGIDVWVKRVRYHIIDTWYAGDSLKGKARISYHVDHGEGADFFTVGRSLGAGGCAIWKDSLFHQTGLFSSYQIIATGPIRSKFVVYYDGDSINGKPFKEIKTYTQDAGQNLTRIDVAYSGLEGKGKTLIATGLVKRKNIAPYADKKLGLLSVWGSTNDDSANGSLGIGVIIPQKSFYEMNEDDNHYLAIGKSSPDKIMTYYAGAGWTRSGDFHNENEWKAYLKNYAERLRQPLKITVSRNK
jgi:hypothetical protein